MKDKVEKKAAPEVEPVMYTRMERLGKDVILAKNEKGVGFAVKYVKYGLAPELHDPVKMEIHLQSSVVHPFINKVFASTVTSEGHIWQVQEYGHYNGLRTLKQLIR